MVDLLYQNSIKALVFQPGLKMFVTEQSLVRLTYEVTEKR